MSARRFFICRILCNFPGNIYLPQVLQFPTGNFFATSFAISNGKLFLVVNFVIAPPGYLCAAVCVGTTKPGNVPATNYHKEQSCRRDGENKDIPVGHYDATAKTKIPRWGTTTRRRKQRYPHEKPQTYSESKIPPSRLKCPK